MTVFFFSVFQKYPKQKETNFAVKQRFPKSFLATVQFLTKYKYLQNTNVLGFLVCQVKCQRNDVCLWSKESILYNFKSNNGYE